MNYRLTYITPAIADNEPFIWHIRRSVIFFFISEMSVSPKRYVFIGYQNASVRLVKARTWSKDLPAFKFRGSSRSNTQAPQNPNTDKAPWLMFNHREGSFPVLKWKDVKIILSQNSQIISKHYTLSAVRSHQKSTAGCSSGAGRTGRSEAVVTE